MATYRGRKHDISRKVGQNIWGHGKSPATKRPYAAGQHGPMSRDMFRQSEYGEQLLAKQVIKRYYGMMERQLRRTFEKSLHMRGNTGLNFLRLLELRLQTAVYRLGYARTIFQARQMVSHGHVTVNDKKVDIPSYTLSVGDEIGLRQREDSRNIAKHNAYEGARIPNYMDVDVANYKGKIDALPEREDLPELFDEQKVVEFYAR